jgi:pyruvate carboxylase
LEPGKSIIVKLLSIGIPNEDGVRIVFFSVNGENRFIEIKDKAIKVEKEVHLKIDPQEANQYGAPLQGSLYKILVKKGQEIKKNDHLFIIEAMKMETTITANKAGKVKSVSLKPGTMVMKDDLILTLE